VPKTPPEKGEAGGAHGYPRLRDLCTNMVDLKGENGKTKNYQGMWVLPASLQGGFGGVRKNSHVHDLDLC
jgi:hypothetical protein